MNDIDLDPRVIGWLGEGPRSAPPQLVESSFAAAARVGQAPRWAHLPGRDPLATPILGRRSSPMVAVIVLVLIVAVVATALLAGGGLAFPDGPVRNGPLVFADGSGSGMLLIADRPGATARPLTIAKLGAKESELPAISPDGTRVAFYFLDPVSLAAGVGVANLDGSNLVTFPATYVPLGPDGLPHEPGSWAPITWSGDAKRILYVDKAFGPGTVMLGDVQSGSARPLLLPGGLKADSPSWSPDGRRIVLRTVDPSSEDKTGLAVVDLDGDGVREIGATDGSFAREDYAAPQWSPDGSVIAFQAAPTAGGAHDIFTIRPDGSGKAAITASAEDELWPTWAPDGRHLAWIVGTPEDVPNQGVMWSDKNGRDVIVANADGTEARIVSGAVSGRIFVMPFFGWSPDGAKVFAVVCEGQLCDRAVELDAFGSSEPVFVNGPVPGPTGVSWGRQP